MAFLRRIAQQIREQFTGTAPPRELPRIFPRRGMVLTPYPHFVERDMTVEGDLILHMHNFGNFPFRLLTTERYDPHDLQPRRLGEEGHSRAVPNSIPTVYRITCAISNLFNWVVRFPFVALEEPRVIFEILRYFENRLRNVPMEPNLNCFVRIGFIRQEGVYYEEEEKTGISIPFIEFILRGNREADTHTINDILTLLRRRIEQIIARYRGERNVYPEEFDVTVAIIQWMYQYPFEGGSAGLLKSDYWSPVSKQNCFWLCYSASHLIRKTTKSLTIKNIHKTAKNFKYQYVTKQNMKMKDIIKKLNILVLRYKDVIPTKSSYSTILYLDKGHYQLVDPIVPNLPKYDFDLVVSPRLLPDVKNKIYKNNILEKDKINDVYSWDIETITEKSNLFSYCVTSRFQKYAFVSGFGLENLVIKEFINGLIIFADHFPPKHIIYFYAHFGGRFDDNALLSALLDYPANIIRIDNKCLINGQNRLMKLSLTIKTRNFIFLDSGLMLGVKLKTLGKDFKTLHQKLKLDHTSITRENHLLLQDKITEYALNDVHCLHEVLEYFHNYCYNTWGISPIGYITLTSYARALAHTHNLKKGQLSTLPKVNEINERSSYFGGRCQSFFFGEYIGKIYYYDVTSEYPFIAATNAITTFFEESCQVKLVDNLFYTLDGRAFTGYVECSFLATKEMLNSTITSGPPRDKRPLLPVRTSDGDIIYPYFESWSTPRYYYYQEVYKALKIGYKIKGEIFNADKFKETWFLSKFMIDLSTKRARAKANNRTAEAFILKQIMNSTLGYYAIREERTQMHVFDANSKTDWKDFKIDVAKETVSKIKKIGDYVIYYSDSKIDRKENNVAISSAVNALARMYLYDIFDKIEELGGKVLYGDTDSVFTNLCIEKSSMFTGIIKNGFGEGKLGSLKNEMVDFYNICNRKSIKRTGKPLYSSEEMNKLKEECYPVSNAIFMLKKSYIFWNEPFPQYNAIHNKGFHYKSFSSAKHIENFRNLITRNKPFLEKCSKQIRGGASRASMNNNYNLIEKEVTKRFRVFDNNGTWINKGDISEDGWIIPISLN